jgi:hypothetical protein
MMESHCSGREGGEVGRGKCMCLREGIAEDMREGAMGGPSDGDIAIAMNNPEGGWGGGRINTKIDRMPVHVFHSVPHPRSTVRRDRGS